MIIWLTLITAGLLTFAIRLSFIVVFGGRPIPRVVHRALRFVPAAVLTAIILPDLLLPGKQLDLSLGNARLLAGLLAAVVAWRTRNILLTIVAGMGALWILNALAVSL